jgi:hypothetical protein
VREKREREKQREEETRGARQFSSKRERERGDFSYGAVATKTELQNKHGPEKDSQEERIRDKRAKARVTYYSVPHDN